MTPFVIGLAVVVLTLVFAVVGVILSMRALRVELEQLRGELKVLRSVLRPPAGSDGVRWKGDEPVSGAGDPGAAPGRLEP